MIGSLEELQVCSILLRCFVTVILFLCQSHIIFITNQPQKLEHGDKKRPETVCIGFQGCYFGYL